MTVTDRPATYREVFAEPTFSTLFAARTLAISANSLQIFALSVLVYASTGSPLLSALAFGAGFLPQFAGGLLLGSLTDRLPARPLIVAGYTVEAALAATLCLAGLPVVVNLLLVAAVACFTPVFSGAASKVIAERLIGDAYVLGRSLTSMSSSAAQLLGLAGGGVAVATLGARPALLVAAVCHLFAAVVVRLGLPGGRASGLPGGWSGGAPGERGSGLPGDRSSESPGDRAGGLPSEKGSGPPGEGERELSGEEGSGLSGVGESGLSGEGRSAGPKTRGAVRDSWTGAVSLLADRTIRRLLLAQWLPSAFVAGSEALLVAYAARRGFAAGAGAILMAAPAVGMLIGNFAVGRLLRPSVRERLSAPLVILLGAPLITLLAPLPLPVVTAVLVLAGTGFAYGLGLQREFLEAAPADRLGQLFALLSTGLMALQGVGPLVFGAVAELASPATAIAAAGIATSLVALPIHLRRRSA